MLVTSLDQLPYLLRIVNNEEILAYDTETTGLNARRDSVIGIAVSGRTAAFYIPVLQYANGNLADTGLRPVALAVLAALQNKKLIMWNASFDCRITEQSLGVDLLPALHADVMLMKHTVDEEQPFGLKEVASRLWGTDEKAEQEELKASIKANGGTTKQYYKADVSVLAKYACQDVMLTMRLYNHYYSKLRQYGLEDFYFRDEVLPLYREVVIPMEKCGVQLNLPLLEQSASELEIDLADLESQIQEQIKPLLRQVFIPWLLNKKYPPRTEKGNMPKWAKEGLTQEQAWHRDNDGYMFNLSSTHHLKKLFFDTLGETPLSRTPTGRPKVDDDFIRHISAKYPWCNLLTNYNKLVKIRGTYVQRFLDEHEDGRFYPDWKVHGTVSGRLAGDFQQLPRPLEPGQASELVLKHNNRIREFIIPAPNFLLCSADYEQLEPTIFAHTSTDFALQSIFTSGADFYSEVAIRTERLEGISSDKKAPNYLGKIDKSKRQKAKAYALGIAYGLTDYKLQFELNVSQEEAAELIRKYLDAFPGLANWIVQSHAQAIEQGFVTTEMGRRRHFPRLKGLFDRWGVNLLDSLDLWKKYHASPAVYEEAKIARRQAKKWLNNAVNFQPQCYASSIINRASINIVRELKSKGLGAQIIATVHDEIVLEVPATEAQAVGEIVKRNMENVVKLSVPLKAEPQFGNNFRECK